MNNVNGLHNLTIDRDFDDSLWPTKFYRVMLDGQEVRGVTRLKLEMGEDEMPVLNLEMHVNVESVKEVALVESRRIFSEAYLNRPVSDLGLSVRAYNAIMRGTVKKDGWRVVERDLNKTVGDVVVAYKNGRLKRYYLLGKKSYDEVCGKLKELGLIEED